MKYIQKTEVSLGIFYIEIKEANLRILCSSPPDVVKHLISKKHISKKELAGVIYETGPNAILLNDLNVQNLSFTNLCEFPVLQMLYRQGMIIPNHPNNDGHKPMLIGSTLQVDTQCEYIFKGNYGLRSIEEIESCGLSNEEAKNIMKIKRKFAFGKIKETNELLEKKYLNDNLRIEIKNEVYMKRIAFNIFEIRYKDEHVLVDLNLGELEEYKSPYDLGFYDIKKDYFSVIHSGQGDGWALNSPSMSSIITYQGKIYLIDAGPNIKVILNALGIGLNDIEGIFHTHAHDDHFAGLTTLLQTDHKIKYYSTKLVRLCVFEKLSSLLSIEKSQFENYFDFHDLSFDKWNNIVGLEVKAVLSPHPIETNILFFRTFFEVDYVSYAHLADISSFKVLDSMIGKDGVSKEYIQKIKDAYLTKVDLKKLDIGGGMIHGDAKDFENDQSSNIILAHTETQEYSQIQKVIGRAASFGSVDVLLSSNKDYLRRDAFTYVSDAFNDVSIHEIESLLNCNIITFNPGTIMLKEKSQLKDVFLILAGTVEKTSMFEHVSKYIYSGSFIGDDMAMLDDLSENTFRTDSYVKALVIPKSVYMHFIKNNSLEESLKDKISKHDLLNKFDIFSESLSYQVESKIVKSFTSLHFLKNEKITNTKDCLNLVIEGSVVKSLEKENKKHEINIIRENDFFNEEKILDENCLLYEYRANTNVEIYCIPKNIILDIPIVYWNLYNSYQKCVTNSYNI